MAAVAASKPVPSAASAPRDNELYRRFRSFMDGGPRVVIPQESLRGRTCPPSASSTDPGGAVEVMPAAATFATGAAVVLRGLVGRPELNGQRGEVIKYSGDTERYEVRLDCGEVKRVREANIEALRPGTATSSRAAPQAPATPSAEGAAQELRPEDRVRIVGLVARSDLNGHEGSLVSHIEAEGRWRVRMDDGSGKTLRAEHLERLGSAGPRPAARSAAEGLVPAEGPQGLQQPLFTRELVNLGSMSSILTLCERTGEAVTTADAATALHAMAQCPDRGVALADPRMLGFLAQAREALQSRASPQDVLKMLGAILAMDLRSAPTLEVLAARAVQHAESFTAAELVLIVKGFADLDYQDVVGLLDVAARVLLPKVAELTASEAVCVAAAFAKVRWRHFELLDQLSPQVAAGLADVSSHELAQGAFAFAFLEALDFRLLEGLAKEAQRRQERLSELSHIALLAYAVSPAAAASAGPLSTAVRATLGSARAALARAAGRQAAQGTGTATHETGDLAALADSLFEHSLSSLEEALLARARKAAVLLRAFSTGSSSPDLQSVQGLRELCGTAARCCWNSLGARGTWCAVERIGVKRGSPGFMSRAANRISWASTVVEDWNARTVRRPSYTFAEHALGSASAGSASQGGGSRPVGEAIRHDGQPRPPRAQLDQQRGFLGEALVAGSVAFVELCSLCLVLGEVFEHAFAIATADAIPQDRLHGSVEVFVTDPPGAIGLLALARFRCAFPSVDLSLALGREAPPAEALPDLDEVLDVDCDAADSGAEKLEIVD